MEVNSNKIVTMKINNCDDSHHHTIVGVLLHRVVNFKDLEVVISNDTKCTSTCKASASKRFKVVCVIRKPCHYMDVAMFSVLYPRF